MRSIDANSYYLRSGALDVAFELLDIGATQYEIADELNRRGLHTVQCTPFVQPIVSKMLSRARRHGTFPERLAK